MLWLPLYAGLLATAPQSPPVDIVKVDPLLLVQAREIWSIVGQDRNPVWPGWNAKKTPILIYFPGRQDLLINHPHPPKDFRPYRGPLKTPIGAIYVRDKVTKFNQDGQNTSTDIDGVETLVVADTLSTRRQWVESVASTVAANPDDSKDLIANGLYPNVYDSMTMFVHEAFHVYQRQRAAKKIPGEMSLLAYPSLSAKNNAGYALEAELLGEAIRAKTDAELHTKARQWLAVRLDRRAALGKEQAAYEDGTEFSEGLAKYVEYRTLQALETRRPAPEMWLNIGFRGYGDLSAERDRLLRSMQGFMNGSNVVNGDLYGASPVRFRLYYSGMAVGALLDRLGAKWHEKMLGTDATLTGLATEAIHPTPAELAEALMTVRQSARYAEWMAKKEKLAADGEAYLRAEEAKFDQAPGEVVLDYSALPDPKLQFGFTAFGILRLDDDRNIFRLVPIRGQLGETSFAEDGARPVLYDRKAKQVRIPLKAAADTVDLSAKDLDLPGVSIKGIRGTVRREGRRIVIRLAA